MLKKEQRLNLRQSFGFITSGKRIETPLFKIFFQRGENTQPLIGVACRTKDLKSAVNRNKAKRLIFKAIGNIYNQLPSDLNVMLMPKRTILEKSSLEIEMEIKKCL